MMKNIIFYCGIGSLLYTCASSSSFKVINTYDLRNRNCLQIIHLNEKIFDHSYDEE